jgi:hypothetical protein
VGLPFSIKFTLKKNWVFELPFISKIGETLLSILLTKKKDQKNRVYFINCRIRITDEIYIVEGEKLEGLKFRLLNIEDFDDCIELFKDNEVCRFRSWQSWNSNERCKLWFEMTFDRYKNDLGGQNILIEKKYK